MNSGTAISTWLVITPKMRCGKGAEDGEVEDAEGVAEEREDETDAGQREGDGKAEQDRPAQGGEHQDVEDFVDGHAGQPACCAASSPRRAKGRRMVQRHPDFRAMARP
jgi:hypothetical protein